MKKRICHVTCVHNPFDTRIFHKECKSLTAEYEVYLIAPNIGDQIVDNVHICGVQLQKSRLKRMLNQKVIHEKMIEIDAVSYHFHDPELLPLGPKIKKRGKVAIFDCHEDVPLDIICRENIPYPLRKLLSIGYARYEKQSFRKYDALISVTPTIVNRLKSVNENTVQITNYPILEVKEDNRKWGNCIGFIGGIGPSWNHINILKSIEDIQVKYALAGKDDTGYANELRNMPAWSKVDYRGFIKHEDAIQLLNDCSVGMALYCNDAYFYGNYGSLGNTKLFEYMMVGIPVIASNYVLWKEIVDKYNCGICVNPHNVGEISDAINYLLNHRDEAKKMGDNGRYAIEKEYNWDTQATILLDLYKKLLG